MNKNIEQNLKMLSYSAWGFVIGLAMSHLLGCAPLQPGADPLVVRTEQAERSAVSTFTLVLNVDDSNRPFFKTNAPAFHAVCEWLRAPLQVDSTNPASPGSAATSTLPRCLALVKNLDNIKLDYKASRTSSNSLYSAIVFVDSLTTQASAWLPLVTNVPGPLIPKPITH